MNEELTPMEEASGRATRARTRLIVEGFANLALVAILFSGVQAQLISVTNDDNNNKLDVATNAMFFGGLIFSVFTAMLATLSGRWFSILREDDSDYLSSCWLAQDCGERGEGPKLEQYLKYQMNSLREKIELEELKSRRASQVVDNPPTVLCSQKAIADTSVEHENSPTGDSQVGTNEISLGVPGSVSRKGTVDDFPPNPTTGATPNSGQAGSDSYNPMVKDLERIIKLLQVEQKDGSGAVRCKRLKPGHTTLRERVLSVTLLSALAASVAAFLLFCAGILMLTWNKQPRAVAIFTSATVAVCVIPLVCFFLRHRHKHVIKHLHLGRPGL